MEQIVSKGLFPSPWKTHEPHSIHKTFRQHEEESSSFRKVVCVYSVVHVLLGRWKKSFHFLVVWYKRYEFRAARPSVANETKQMLNTESWGRKL